ncbi:MAG: hypothetical protein GQ542_10625 [Desulforhopalus sp.]|nr:hypothetical protein [Desulforhopalus sp.]
MPVVHRTLLDTGTRFGGLLSKNFTTAAPYDSGHSLVRPKMKFYRNIFAVACFAFFLSAMMTNSAFGFLIAMVCGMLSRTAEKKGWSDPF